MDERPLNYKIDQKTAHEIKISKLQFIWDGWSSIPRMWLHTMHGFRLMKPTLFWSSWAALKTVKGEQNPKSSSKQCISAEGATM